MGASDRQQIYRIDDDIDVEAGILVTLDKNLSGELTFESAESEKYPVVKGVGYLQENGTKKIDKLIPDMESGTTAGALPALPGDGSGRGFSKELPETPCNPFIHVL